MVLFMIISVRTQARSVCLCYSQFIIGELKQFTNKCLIKFLDMWLEFSFTIWYSRCMKAKISVKSTDLFYILFSTQTNFRKLEIKFSIQYFKGCCFTYFLFHHFINLRYSIPKSQYSGQNIYSPQKLTLVKPYFQSNGDVWIFLEGY